jgi:GrpB-like predicted nucleotidyltransferase (UPF0157 family)
MITDNTSSVLVPYRINEYNPVWPLEFEKIKSFLEPIFADKAILIEHIGSTSVPNMKAKPLIDVLITTDKIHSLDYQKEKMTEAGYKIRENLIEPNSILFYKTNSADGQKTENIHVCKIGSPKAIQFIVMRDYLCTHSDEALAYGDLKEKLFAQAPGDYESYRNGKTEFLNKLEERAALWKLQNF